MVSAGGESEPDSLRQQREERLRALEAELALKHKAGEDIPPQLRAQIDKLRRQSVQELVNRLAVRVLEIDPVTGKLFYRNPERVDIRDEADAQRLIEADRQAQGVSKRELMVLILYPRDPASDKPTVAQRESYDRWFQGVPLSYDRPGAEVGRKP
jgi:hypothetical protein